MRNKGFTLVEVVASMVIVALSLVAIMQIFSIGSKALSFSKEETVAANLLRKKIEEIKCKDFSVDVTEGPNVPAEGFPGYSYHVVETTNYDSNPYLKKVYVSINWADQSGVLFNESLSTLVADY